MDKKATGFASPTQGYEEQNIDLNRLLIRNPPATYFGRLDTGDMENLGLPRGSLLIIDRSKDPKPNSLFCGVLCEDQTLIDTLFHTAYINKR